MSTTTSYETIDRDGLAQGMHTLHEAHKKWKVVNFDRETQTIRVADDYLLLRNSRNDFSKGVSLNTYIVYGRRYRADGWSDCMPLFRIWVGRDRPAKEVAEDHRRRGVGGAATHGCETIISVEME